MQEAKDKPLVSIFAICYNQAAFVKETLQSIKNQTYPFIQLIIIDNASTDGSAECIKDWIEETNAVCEFIKNDRPLSVAANCNAGLSKVKGKYFQGISCDDIMLPEKIEKQAALFESLDEKYACIYADTIRIDENGSLLPAASIFTERKKKFGYSAMPHGDLWYELQYMTFIAAPSVLLRTSAVKDVGGYRSEFYIEDWPLWIGLSVHGYLFYPLDATVVQYRIHPASMDQKRDPEFYRSLLLTYEIFRDFFDFSQKTIREKWLYALLQYRKSGRPSFRHFRKYIQYTRSLPVKNSVRFLLKK